MKPLSIVILLTTLLLVYCKRQGNQLGEVDFIVTGKEEAQPHFKKGLLLLHSFEYDDAADAFREAKTIDPEFVMCYWGEAMTYNHSLWRFQDYDSADSILQMLAPTPEGRVAKAQTQLEKDFIEGVNILYGKGTKLERDSAYAAHMADLYKKYPENNEVAAFYSIALIGSKPVRETRIYEEAAEVAKKVLATNPKHPGALHYIIHAYDDPDHALLAMQTADAYSVVAPDAGHALHMPSHIYLASGLWDKVVSSNEAAWAASEKRKESKQLSNDALNYHALHWLEYGYLQQGRTADARRLVENMKAYCAELPSRRALSHLIYLKTTYQVETNDYIGEFADIEVAKNDLNLSARALEYFAEGMKAWRDNECLILDSLIHVMTAERLLEEERSSGDNIRTCAGINELAADATDILNSHVIELELKAIQALLHGDDLNAEKYFREAVELESSGTFLYGPPSVVKPSFELYGEWLLENNRPEEALAQFERTLKIHPNRTLAVKGKEKAEKAREAL